MIMILGLMKLMISELMISELIIVKLESKEILEWLHLKQTRN